jgi:4-amino-4-deoxy-L-arabinose transferase-like glycosyltransferase
VNALDIKKNKIAIILFSLILLTGIFLRTYNFHPWLRFSEDEARDAEIVDNAIMHRESLPLLGPLAGTSEFRLGPAYYYIQYSAARIFGNEPVKLAYPDLAFSILAIPLFYFLLRKYFEKDVTLATTAVFSLSYFLIKYSRFAWNPNSTPFFSILFLYSFLELADPKTKRRSAWAVLAGAALGIGIQLHTTFLLVFSLAFLIGTAYGLRKKIFRWREMALIVLVALVFNVPQIA